MVDGEDPEAVRRSIARFMHDAYRREPAWWTLTSDFATHASTRPEVRERLREIRDGFFDAMAGLIDALGRRHGIAYTLPAKEIARGTSALMRGMVMDWVLEPGADEGAVFEEMVAAYLRGAAVPRDEGSAT